MERSEAIHEKCKLPPSPDTERELNNIADQVQHAMLAAEQKASHTIAHKKSN
jgi:hypothetical protein